jgi:hypothetical protein
MKTGSSRPFRRPALIVVALFAALALVALAGCADSSPVAAPTSTLPEQVPSDAATAEVDIPEYETELDLTAEEEEAVDGALEALDGYIATLNEALSSGGVATEDIGDYSQGEALEALREDSSALKHDEQYMAGEFSIEDRVIHSIDPNIKQVTILTCVDNSAFAKVDNGSSLPTNDPQLLRVVFIAQLNDKLWKIDSQNLWSEPCAK